MAALIYRPLWAVATFGAVLVLLHNAFDAVDPAKMTPLLGTLWRFLHVPGMLVPPASGNFWITLYPLIPWPGIMALGFALGPLLQRPAGQRQRLTLLLGLGSIAIFTILRFTNRYGDPLPWSQQTSPLRTFLSFMELQKYPPSLLFLLATLGVSLCLMSAFDGWQARGSFRPARAILSLFGRVPFFYYFLHFTMIHLAALLTTAALGLNWRWWIALPPQGSALVGKPEAFGFSLPIVYLIWLAIVALCYFPCQWFAGVKQRRRRPWLSYL
jgi:uncharacterized membrane protein